MSEEVNMSLAQRTHIAVWFDGAPTRLVHDGVRYRVSDQPTRLEDEVILTTHPLTRSGWRFQGTDDAGTSHMFEIRQSGAGWELLRVYD